MRSPVHPAITAWMIRPRPTGLRRVAAGYLCVAAAAAGAAIILAGFDHAADVCTVDGFGCLGLIFRGIALATVAGLAILIGGSIFAKLGGLYVLAVVGFALAGLTITVFLGRLGAPTLPIGIVALITVPAVAAWSTRPRPDRDSARPPAASRALARPSMPPPRGRCNRSPAEPPRPDISLSGVRVAVRLAPCPAATTKTNTSLRTRRSAAGR